ncbi:uncharacterized protein LOC141637253 [Silene latifolia]|uniref:uncharacterized protein LOC141637253 n=1 Tax=Silene latifolia TaxID=37657 RepID=UPI003D771249
MPMEMLDRKLHKTRNDETILLKVLWSKHNVEEATWEPEEAMRERYPHLFDRDIDFQVGDKVLLKVSLMRGVISFGKRGKLSQNFIRPYVILDQIGEVAYRLALPAAVDRVHNEFHVSQIRKYVSDPSHVLEVENIELDQALTSVEMPMEMLDRKLHKTRNDETILLKVLWSKHNVEEATWEPEEAMRERYPHLFDRYVWLGVVIFFF